MPNAPLKAIIFDLDGTLTDSDKVHFQVFQDFFALHNIALDRSMYRKGISGRQNSAILADFLPQLPTEEASAFSEKKEATFRQLAKGNIAPLPGLLTFLEQIKAQDLPAAVVTNAPPENANFMLSELGLTQAFSPVVIGDELPRGKPDPLPYQTALEQLGVQAAEAITFEDSRAGIQSAVGAGIETIGMMTTHSAEELIAAGAARAITDFTDAYVRSLF
ncbi:MAG: HAD family phosphatase [Cyanobacteria bacterium P01_D01_bin.105]